MGGAIALMMAVMLQSDPLYKPIADKLKAVYTIGQPMLATPEFAEKCRQRGWDRNVFRYIHGRDIMPRVPPMTTGRFEHFGAEFHYKGGKPRDPNPSQDWTRNRGMTKQAHPFELPSAVLVDFPLRKFPFTRDYVVRPYNWVHDTLSGWPPFSAAGTLVQSVPLLRLMRPPYIYAVEEHAPHHYIAKLATEGVFSEYGDVR
jgi:hypothetical protein